MRLILFSMILIVARLIPHVANFVPIAVYSVWLISNYSKKQAIIIFFSALLFSDVLLYFMHGYSLFSPWFLINYFSYAILFLVPITRINILIAAGMLLPFSFWMISNLCLWVATPYYAHDFFGLISCFILALPFLKMSVLANTLGSLVVYHEKLIPHPTR